MKTLSIVFATVLTGSLIGAAQAKAPEVEIRERVVSFADLDLSRHAGAETLYRRIMAASRNVCRTSGVASFAATPSMQDCAEQAAARAVADVNAPSLTRLYVERSGGSYHADTRGSAPQ